MQGQSLEFLDHCSQESWNHSLWEAWGFMLKHRWPWQDSPRGSMRTACPPPAGWLALVMGRVGAGGTGCVLSAALSAEWPGDGFAPLQLLLQPLTWLWGCSLPLPFRLRGTNSSPLLPEPGCGTSQFFIAPPQALSCYLYWVSLSCWDPESVPSCPYLHCPLVLLPSS
jgi:hypothetical protein